MDNEDKSRIARKTARNFTKARFGNHPLYLKDYCEGSRRVCDFVEDIVFYDLMGDAKEADFWESELRCLIPEFTEKFRAFGG